MVLFDRNNYYLILRDISVELFILNAFIFCFNITKKIKKRKTKTTKCIK
jgi:hypothetical protein